MLNTSTQLEHSSSTRQEILLSVNRPKIPSRRGDLAVKFLIRDYDSQTRSALNVYNVREFDEARGGIESNRRHKIFSPATDAGLCDNIGRYVNESKHLERGLRRPNYRFEPIRPDGSGKVKANWTS